jgi:hypothetical protein
MKIIAYIKSLFTNEPQPLKDSYWYYRRGKKVSQYDLLLEEHSRLVEKLKWRITNEPNIEVK